MARTVVPRAGSEQTREKILSVSEQLFSALGYDGVSLRQIGAEANVPFALVTYHFKTKLGLYQAVFSRRFVEFQAHRRALLDQVVIQKDAHQAFMAISAAFVGPMMKLRKISKGSMFSQLLAREIFDPNEASRGVIAEYFDPLARMMLELLHRAAPDATPAEVARAYHFATGVLAVNHASSERLRRISGLSDKVLSEGDPNDQLIRFIAAGLLAALYPQAQQPSLAIAAAPSAKAKAGAEKSAAGAKTSGKSPARKSAAVRKAAAG